MEKAISLYLEFWIVTIPFSIYILKKIIPEILDLVFNYTKILRMLQKSAYYSKFSLLEQEHLSNIKNKKQSPSTHLLELQRQLDYSKLPDYQKNSHYDYGALSRAQKAKELSDIFRA